jgi:hypothetical protein
VAEGTPGVAPARSSHWFEYNGFGFFARDTYREGGLFANPVTTGGVRHPVGASYGVIDLLVGTLESSAIAMVLAVPVGIGTAMIVVEKLPARLSSIVGFCLEVLAGVPSVVYGESHPRCPGSQLLPRPDGIRGRSAAFRDRACDHGGADHRGHHA